MCFGCKLANNEVDTFSIFENELFNVILDLDPISDGHLLILPKEHCESISGLTNINELKDLITKIKCILMDKLNIENISICINEGKINDLNHMHVHIIPRAENDKLLYEETNAKEELVKIFNKLK